MNNQYVDKMNTTFDFIDEIAKKLSREIKDLDDVRFAMDALKTIREEYSRIDQINPPIEEAFALLSKFEFEVDQDMANKACFQTLNWLVNQRANERAKFENDKSVIVSDTHGRSVLTLAKKFNQTLRSLHHSSKQNLSAVSNSSVKIILISKKPTHMKDQWLMVSNPPKLPNDWPFSNQDLMVSLGSFLKSKFQLPIGQQMRNEVLKTGKRKFITYSSGEGLFGMAVTSYPKLESIKKELSLLQKLYGLYNAVMDSIDGYYDIPWAEVDTEVINGQLLDFQNKCKKLPKGLKEWQAFLDLSQVRYQNDS